MSESFWLGKFRLTDGDGHFKVKGAAGQPLWLDPEEAVRERSERARRVVVSADGQGVVSHAGVGLLLEMAEYTGLVEG